MSVKEFSDISYHESVQATTNEQTTSRKEKAWERCLLVFIMIVVPIGFVAIFLSAWNMEYDFQNNWKVVENTTENANITNIQVGTNNTGKYSSQTIYITIETVSGKTGTFALGENHSLPDAISIGGACTVCVKQFSCDKNTINYYDGLELKDGDTAWFINDEIVFYQSDEEVSAKHLWNFE